MKSNKWIAAALAFFAMPMGMLYVARPWWAAIYLGMAMSLAIFEIWFHQILSIPAAMALQFALPAVCALHAWRLAARIDESASRPWYATWYGMLGGTVIFLSVIVGTRAFLFEPFRSPAGSMTPFINPGSFLIAKKWGYGHYSAYGLVLARANISSELKRGDVIVFEYPPDRSLIYTKRLIGLPGDRISYMDKHLSINGQPVKNRQLADYLDQDRHRYLSHYLETLGEAEYDILIDIGTPSYSQAATRSPLEDKCVYAANGLSCEIPSAHYFVMGDNRDNSNDSRIWGFVPADHIVGKVVYVKH